MNIFTDFDGTIAVLDVEWSSFKLEVRKLISSINKNLSLDLSFSQQIEFLLKQNQYKELAELYEMPNGKANIIDINSSFINGVLNPSRFAIISNNLTSTIVSALDQIGLECDEKNIYGVDKFLSPKPSIAAWNLVKSEYNLSFDEITYYGDRESDRVFSSAVGIKFEKICIEKDI